MENCNKRLIVITPVSANINTIITYYTSNNNENK